MKHPKRTIAIILAVCLVLGEGGFQSQKTGLLIRITDTVSRTFLSAELDAWEGKTQSFTLESLREDERITFDQSGMLVNTQNMLPEDFEAEITEYKDTGVRMNSAMTEAYAALSARILEQFGQKLFVRSSYRTAEEQAQQILEEGEKATAVGASEHQTGLALDVYVKSYAGAAFIKSEVGQWVNGRCWEYGFIIRYPYYKENVDGIGYEPWHIRYVGKPHAEILYKESLTLEEYIALLADGQWRQYGNTCISRQSGEQIVLPADFASATISPDNGGGYLVTVLMES